MRPSFLGLVFGGILILIALIYFFTYCKSIKPIELVYIILLLSIAISTHSLLHSNEEIYFNFNPFVGDWTPSDKPVLMKNK